MKAVSSRPIRVLFVCVQNSARSQMAEGLLRHLGGDDFAVESAGLEPGTLNPLAVKVMEEAGIDISGADTNSVFEYFKQGRRYHLVITVCDEAAAERCPIFPGTMERMHWGLPDPAALTGSEEDKLSGTRKILDQLRKHVEDLVAEVQGQ